MADSSSAYPTLNPQDRDAIIRTVMGEAGSDPDSQAGVVAVIGNRMLATGQSGTQTVLQSNGRTYQFEPWGSRAKELLGYSPDSQAYKNIGSVVDGVFGGSIADPTGGAKLFYSPTSQAAMGRQPPAWDDGSGIDLGKHRFFGGSPAQPMSDDDIGAMYGGAAGAPAPKGMSDDEIGQMYGGSDGAKQATVTLPGGQSIGFLPPNATPQPPNPGQYFDRTAPISQQLGTAASQVGNYLGGQVAGIPGAISNDFHNAQSLAYSGMADLDAGRFLPTFPSSDPQTWTGGGVLKSLGGVMGEITSPLSGAVHQLVEGPVTQATGSPEIGQRAGFVANAAAAPAAGVAARATGNALMSATIGDLSPETAALADMARTRYGIPVNMGQISDAPGVRFASSTLNRMPFSGAGADAATQQTAFNRAVTSTIGENADLLTPRVMNAARQRIGQVFEDVGGRTTLNADPQFDNALQSTLLDASRRVSDSEMRTLTSSFDDIMSKVQNGQMSGEAYQALRASGSPLDNATGSESSNVRYYASQLRDVLDDAFQRSASPSDQAAITQARQQWANLKTLEPLAAKSETGDVVASLLKGRINAQTNYGLAYGRGGDLGNLARIGSKFLKEPPSSGTAERGSTMAGVASIAKAGVFGGAAVMAPAFVPHFVPSISPLEALLPAATVPATLMTGRMIGGALRSNALAEASINRALGRVGPMPSSMPLSAMFGLGGLINGQPSQNALMPR